MKKSYMEPSVEVVNVNTENLICVSTIPVGDDYDGVTTPLSNGRDIEDMLGVGNLW